MKIDYRITIGANKYRFDGEGDTEEECASAALEEFGEVICGLPIDKMEEVERYN